MNVSMDGTMVRPTESSIFGRLAIAVLCVVIVLRLVSLRRRGRLNLPPGPMPWPVVGNLPALGVLPHQGLAKLAKTYGPLMMLRLGSVQTLIVSSPKMAKEVLKTQDKVFSSRPSFCCNEIMGYGSQSIGFLPYGEQWRNARAIFTSTLTTPKRIADTQRMREEEILFLLQSVLAASEGGKVGVPMLRHFFRLSTNVATRLVMSKRCFGSSTQELDSNMGEFLNNIQEMTRLCGVFNIGDFIPSVKRFDLQGYEKDMWRVREKMDAFFQGLLDTRIEELRRNEVDENADFLTVLLNRPTATAGNPMNDDQIKGILLDVVFAGADTTAITLEWALAELVRRPELLEKCRKEVDDVVGKSRLVQESDLPRLSYILAVVKEALRLHPVGPLLLPHLSTVDTTIYGYFIPAGTRTMINVYAIHRDSQVWDRALEFEPERFLQRDQMEEKEKFNWLPFGSGRRGCPGKPLAMTLMHRTLATILQCFTISMPNSSSPCDMDMAEKFGLGMSLASELEVVLTPRVPTTLIINDKL